MSHSNGYRVALTNDFYNAAGQLKYQDIGLDLLESADGMTVRKLDAFHAEIQPEQLQGVNGIIVLTPRVTTHSLSASDDLLAIGRFGVGFDNVDVAACTAADVVLYITAGAVDYSVAEATVGWMLDLLHHTRMKDQLVRTGRWDERSHYMGGELRNRTLGIIGFGGIGRAVLKILSGFSMNPPLVFDPFVDDAVITSSGARPVELDDLLMQSDFVSVHCPLNDQTRNLIKARHLALMKPTSYLINTARGGIINEADLYHALASQKIAGAALDCFEGEPLRTPPRFADLENVILAPHCIAWTNELFRDIGRAACQGQLDLQAGRRPKGVVNPQVFDQPSFQAKWKKLQSTLR